MRPAFSLTSKQFFMQSLRSSLDSWMLAEGAAGHGSGVGGRHVGGSEKLVKLSLDVVDESVTVTAGDRDAASVRVDFYLHRLSGDTRPPMAIGNYGNITDI